MSDLATALPMAAAPGSREMISGQPGRRRVTNGGPLPPVPPTAWFPGGPGTVSKRGPLAHRLRDR